MGQLSAQCPHCRARMKLQKPELIGKTAKCPSCQVAFIIEPLAAEASSSAAPPSRPTTAAAAPARKPSAAAPLKAKAGAPSAKAPASAASAKTAKPKPDIDFPGDDEEILEAEVIEDEPDDDDWLKALDTLAPKDAGSLQVGKAGSAAPVVRGRIKQASTSTRKKRKRRLRDPDGELPIWLSRTITVAVGATVGLVTMMIWAGLIAKTGLPSRWMAMFIGATVGTGVRLGASKWDFGWFPAVTAALIALSAVIGGKVWGVNLMKRQAVEREAIMARYELRLAKHADYPIYLMAEEIHRSYTDDGISDTHHLWVEQTMYMSESDLANFYNPEKLPEVYGEQRWKEAKERWDSLPDDRKQQYKDDIAMNIESLTAASKMDVNAEVQARDKDRAEYGNGGGALNVFDFIFAGLAVVGAFKIAAGMADSAIDTSQAH